MLITIIKPASRKIKKNDSTQKGVLVIAWRYFNISAILNMSFIYSRVYALSYKI